MFISALIVTLSVLSIAGLRANHRVSASAANASAMATEASAKVVAVYHVERRDLERSVQLSAELHPYNIVSLFAKVSGYLDSISVDYGSRVHAGETIATLQLPEQQAELERTESEYHLAKVSYDRVISVNRETPGMLAQQDIDTARAAYESAKDERDRASVMLEYTKIVAPFDGVVTKRNVDPGALIQQGISGSAAIPIVEVADDYRLRLVVQAPESIVPSIAVGTPVIVHIQGTNQIVRSQIARLSYDVREETRTMHTEVDVPNADLHVKPGMYADATIVLEKRPNVLAVPSQALSNDGDSSVFVVDASGVLRQRPVTIGLRTANWAEIRAGLRAGDAVYLGDRTAVVVGEKVAPRSVGSSGV